MACWLWVFIHLAGAGANGTSHGINLHFIRQFLKT